MYRKILVPLDGSDFAESALPPALSIAERGGGEIHLVAVVTTLPPLMFSEVDESYVKGWFREEGLRAEEYLTKVRDRISTEETPIHIRVLNGAPADVLDERIRKTDVDLVVMTTHGRGPLRRFWIGSIADGLVRRGPCPILLWRPDEEGDADRSLRPTFQHALVPLDGSDRSREILPEVVNAAKLFDARVSLVSVAPTFFPVASAYLPHAVEEDHERDTRIGELRSHLEKVADELEGQGIQATADVVTGQDAADAILEHREKIGADFVAMSTHGRGGVSRMVLGSVADKVIRGGKVPVLVHRHTGSADE